jgi:hypothetical protein
MHSHPLAPAKSTAAVLLPLPPAQSLLSAGPNGNAAEPDRRWPHMATLAAVTRARTWPADALHNAS